MAPIFKRAMSPSSTPIGCQYEIAINQHPNREAWSNCQRRLNIEIAPDNLLTGLVDRVACAST
jgi:hypothetical protein